jgi:hypothetical protein
MEAVRSSETLTKLKVKVKVKVQFTLEHATKARREV